jgi:hypothetical protein
MMVIFQEFLRKFLEIFMDNFYVFSSGEKHLNHLSQTFDKCLESGLFLHPEKCFFGMQQGVLLGHVVSSKGIEVDKDKIQVIIDLLVPTNVSELQGFLGHTGYYRRFILMYAALCMCLTVLLKKEVEFSWNQERQEAFEFLKQKLISAPIVVPPDWSKVFHVYIDASNFCVGENLSQKDDDGHDHPIYYASRQMSAAEKNYTVIEKETSAIIFACKKFRHYLLGYKAIFHTDHTRIWLTNQICQAG